MGILNVTPDSFSDGGRFFEKDEAVKHAFHMEAEGADIIDVGGESTRPGAEEVSAEEELNRIMPVIDAMAREKNILISVDTRKAKVAEAAISAGARLVNDVSGLRFDSRMASVVAKYGVGVIVMHMKGTPKDMQADPIYTDVVEEVIRSLEESISIARRAGISEDKIIIDPGIGFGKTLEHNIEILRRLDELKILNKAICIGVSRKSFIGRLLHLSNAGDRLPGTIAANVIAIMKGANILRVHDV
ncbi:MAG: dihydropteroate synthase, partial [Candidatus Omnitrophota bacterium]|nr:dihydropteroate synthase [Candidatus Omnitrophota bacterium]